jgi:hypothetical protein
MLHIMKPSPLHRCTLLCQNITKQYVYGRPCQNMIKLLHLRSCKVTYCIRPTLYLYFDEQSTQTGEEKKMWSSFVALSVTCRFWFNKNHYWESCNVQQRWALTALGQNSCGWIYRYSPFSQTLQQCAASIYEDTKSLKIEYTRKPNIRNNFSYTVKNAVELLGAFRPDVEKIQYHWWNLFVVLPCVFSSTLLTSKKVRL